MADNVAITPGTGATIATDELPTLEDELEEIALALLLLI